jgi:hypothetical protein
MAKEVWEKAVIVLFALVAFLSAVTAVLSAISAISAENIVGKAISIVISASFAIVAILIALIIKHVFLEKNY